MPDDVDIATRDTEEFLRHLEVLGRSGYTLRSYRLGLADFGRWLADEAPALPAVRRRHIEAYVGKFGLGRAATTVNHRLSVLASFFAFLIRRDTEVGDGHLAAGKNLGITGRRRPRRRLCTQAVLGELFQVDRKVITTAVQDIRPLLERHGYTITPSTVRFPAPADLTAFLANDANNPR
jgi:site-specific recombinase XerC